MTKETEEMIKIIKSYMPKDEPMNEKDRQAFEMAIKALEKEPCEDAISRQAVNEIMGYVVDYWREHAIDIEPHEIKDTVIEQFEYTAKQLNELPSVSPTRPTKWIPVSERLPEKRGCYIVTEKVFSIDDREHKGRFNTMVEQVEFYNGKWQRASFFEITAWMPLPEPYKAESEEKE